LGEVTTTGSGLVVDALDLRHHVMRGFLHLLERAAAAHALHVSDLACDGRAVLRQIVGERGELAEQPPPEPRDQQDRQHEDDDDRGDVMQPHPTQQRDHWAQEERCQQRQRDRDEHDACPVEARDRQDQRAQDGEPRGPGRVERLERGHSRRSATGFVP